VKHTPAAVFLAALALTGCGGGDGGSAPAPAPSPTPSKVTLGTSNYRSAATLAMASASSAFWYSRFAIALTDEFIDRPLNLFPTSCPTSGAMQLELTDRNRDSTFDPNDTLHFRWDNCKALGITTTGTVRVELTEGTLIPGGRQYHLTVTISDLRMVNDATNVAVNVNFLAQVEYTHTATSDHIVIPSAVFSSGQVVGDTGSSTLLIDYLQDYAAQTYRYSASGSTSSGQLGGEVDFATPVPFTGVVGEYPSAGRMTLSGSANSSARLAEEGTAAGDAAAVFAAVDINGDGVLDASDAQLAWTNVVPVLLFDEFADQAVIDLPTP